MSVESRFLRSLFLWAFAVLPVAAVFGQNSACLDCHSLADDEVGVGSPIESWSESVHGFAECLDCHPEAVAEDHMDSGSPPACTGCHEEAVLATESSAHGREGGAAQRSAGGCQICHGPIHRLAPSSDASSPIHPSRIAETCGGCHANSALAEDLGIRLVQPLAAYSASVHARAVAEGDSGANCSSCHGAHDIRPAAEPDSKVNRKNVVSTCGRCHQEIANVYAASVHGKAAAHGIQESPICTDCHGEHRILGPDYRDSPVFATNIPKVTCGRCHGDLRLSDKFGLASGKVPTYADSFHGLASRSGSVTVANCSSCHGVHDILPSSDPMAHTHAEKLSETCGSCHPGAGKRFAIGLVHVATTENENAAVYWIRLLYLWMIYLVIGLMLVHNLLDLYRKAGRSEPINRLRGMAAKQRMSSLFRVAHFLLAMSFVVLAYTGFALKYPESWWAEPLLQWEGLFGLRGWIHRAAAALLLVAVAVHGVHVVMNRRARRVVAAMWFQAADWREFRARVRWLLGRSETRPPDPWLGYVEKVEYLAVVWGTVVMAMTGLLLWFEDLTLRWLPTWVLDVSTVVHFYEAVLATLAILAWHFYSVFFDPAVYPMDTAWLTGRSVRKRTAPPWRRAKPVRKPKAGS